MATASDSFANLQALAAPVVATTSATNPMTAPVAASLVALAGAQQQLLTIQEIFTSAGIS